jgi:hypothetical protein
MSLCKSLHDSVTAVTAETEQKDTGKKGFFQKTFSLFCKRSARLITASLNPFTQSQFMSAERFLDTMVEARASFSNLDDVTEVREDARMFAETGNFSFSVSLPPHV